MEKKIIQLSEYEYNRLQEKAELNDGKIRELAEKYYQGRRKIERILSDACQETFENKFGDAIEFKNHYADALRKFPITRWVAYTIAFSGWGVAAALIVNVIFK